MLIDKTGIRNAYSGGIGRLHYARTGNESFPRGGASGRHGGNTAGLVGEAGVRVYDSSGQPGGARADKLLYQAKLALTEDLRLKVVRKMYELRFREPPPARRSVEQLRGIEGSRVRQTYALLAKQYGVKMEWSQIRS